jgi:predicted Zn-dependent protease
MFPFPPQGADRILPCFIAPGGTRTDRCDNPAAKTTLARLLGTDCGQHFASVTDGLRGYRARHQFALACSRLREDSEAEWLWQAVLGERPDFLPAHVGLGELFLAQQRFDDVRRQAELLAALPGGALESALLGGKIHLQREEFTQARLLLEEASRRLPGCAPLLSPLSYALLREGRDPASAEAVLLDLLRSDPNNAGARQNLEVLRRR